MQNHTKGMPVFVFYSFFTFQFPCIEILYSDEAVKNRFKLFIIDTECILNRNGNENGNENGNARVQWIYLWKQKKYTHTIVINL